MLFDSHAHFDDAKFDMKNESGQILRDMLLSRAFDDDGVKCIINAGTSIKTGDISISLAEKYKRIYAAVGIHPEELEVAEKDPDGTLDKLKAQLCHPKVQALGEIGLDYHYDTDKKLQKKWFELQMDLAGKLDMPVQIHDREAHGDCMDIVSRFPDVRGVFHSFSGSAEMAKELIERGWYISFSGVITFKNAVRIAEVVRSVPLDRILSETDSPYLAPHPFRGQLNYSGYVRLTVERLAELKGVSFDEMCSMTCNNACEFFGIDKEILN